MDKLADAKFQPRNMTPQEELLERLKHVGPPNRLRDEDTALIMQHTLRPTVTDCKIGFEYNKRTYRFFHANCLACQPEMNGKKVLIAWGPDFPDCVYVMTDDARYIETVPADGAAQFFDAASTGAEIAKQETQFQRLKATLEDLQQDASVERLAALKRNNEKIETFLRPQLIETIPLIPRAERNTTPPPHARVPGAEILPSYADASAEPGTERETDVMTSRSGNLDRTENPTNARFSPGANTETRRDGFAAVTRDQDAPSSLQSTSPVTDALARPRFQKADAISQAQQQVQQRRDRVEHQHRTAGVASRRIAQAIAMDVKQQPARSGGARLGIACLKAKFGAASASNPPMSAADYGVAREEGENGHSSARTNNGDGAD